MIIDTIDNASSYAGLGPSFKLAFDYLAGDRARTDPIGEHRLDGENVYAIVQQYDTRPRDGAQWEAHRKYADVQYVVSGCEQIGVALLGHVAEAQAYNREKDYALYSGDGAFVTFHPGMFGVFLPQDAHMPCLHHGAAAKVRKVVVKVRVDG